MVALVVPQNPAIEFAEEKSYNDGYEFRYITTNPKMSSTVTTPEPLAIPCQMWPVSHVGLNDDGSMVVLVSTRQGVIQGYDKRELKWTLSVHFRGKVLESFSGGELCRGFST